MSTATVDKDLMNCKMASNGNRAVLVPLCFHYVPFWDAGVSNWDSEIFVLLLSRWEGAFAPYLPVPESDTDCGEPVALSAMLNVAVRDDLAVGLKVTEKVQFAPADKVAPQVVVFAKSPG